MVYLYFLTPDTNYDRGACFVVTSGDVYDNDDVNYVYISHGRLTRQSIPNFIQNYWWLRSPYTTIDDYTCFVDPYGTAGNFNDSNVHDYSYGRSLDRLFQNSISFVVKIAGHGHLPLCVCSHLVW